MFKAILTTLSQAFGLWGKIMDRKKTRKQRKAAEEYAKHRKKVRGSDIIDPDEFLSDD